MLERLKWYLRARKYKRRVEPDEVRFVLRHVRKGDIAVDIGAYKGAFTYWMHKRVGTQGKVYAFEPQPALAEYLRRLARGRPEIYVEGLAVSKEAGTADLFVPLEPGQSASQLASLRASWESMPENVAAMRLTVPVTTLDEYFSTPDRRPVSFIKCDAEGHELNVFQGGERLLTEDQPVLLFECETKKPQQAEYGLKVFEYLRTLGYRGVFFDRIHKVTRPIRNDGVIDPNYSHNFGFLPAGREP